MPSPLTEAYDASLNLPTPRSKAEMTAARMDTEHEVGKYPNDGQMPVDDTQSSSPFLSTVNETTNVSDQENVAPTKTRHSRVLSGSELSPLKMVEEQRRTSAGPSEGQVSARRDSRKLSLERRFPVKISGVSNEGTRPSRFQRGQLVSLEETVRESEGLGRAIAVFEDETNSAGDVQGAEEMGSHRDDEMNSHDGDDNDDSDDDNNDDDDEDNEDADVKIGGDTNDLDTEAATAPNLKVEPTLPGPDESWNPDDTMISSLSTFSAVPNLTMLAKLGQSPIKCSGLGSMAARTTTDRSPSPSRLAGGRGGGWDATESTTNLLIDFTERMRFPRKSPGLRSSISPMRTATTTTTTTPTATRALPANLLDFEIPPMPTPRSVPTVTPRELESLKSGFLAEISSLKASLSGKEAEVQSLKAAVGDAEKRVGQSMEQLRQEAATREQLAAEKAEWERRGHEMESLLPKIRQELVSGQREKEELERKLEESERRREAAEMLHQEAESKLAAMRGGRGGRASAGPSPSSPAKAPSPGAGPGEIEAAVERVARELHALYKSKHEAKVAALKKSYEGRWEKRVAELRVRVDELTAEKEEALQRGREQAAAAAATMMVPAADADDRMARAAADGAAIKELRADGRRLEAEAAAIQADNEALRQMLERERVEKGELVQLAEELMSMQSLLAAAGPAEAAAAAAAAAAASGSRPGPAPSEAPPLRPSGLRTPGSGLRVPRPATGGLPRPGHGLRSGIMSSIEKMGNHRGRAADQ